MSSKHGSMDNGQPSAQPSGGYSAHVRIMLRMGDASFPVSQVGGGKIIFSSPARLPDSRGEVLLSIDGHEQRWPVVISASAGPATEVAAEFGPVMQVHERAG